MLAEACEAVTEAKRTYKKMKNKAPEEEVVEEADDRDVMAAGDLMHDLNI